MKPKKRRRPSITAVEAVAGLADVRSAQVDMRKLQKVFADFAPHLKTMLAMSGRIERLEEIAGSLASELAELKALAERFVAKTGQ